MAEDFDAEPPPTVPVRIGFDADVLDRAKRLADENGRSLSSVVRRALRNYVEDFEGLQ